MPAGGRGIILFATTGKGRRVGNRMAFEVDDEEHDAVAAELNKLRMEHRDLDAAIGALEDLPTADQLQVQRLKKRKLYLRDRISYLEDQLTPDIIA